MIHPERWGHLQARYESASQPRKMLAIDGGGIRGLLTLGMLTRLEDELRKASGAGVTFRLCDFFDYIAGTSTGAIIAAGLARGMSVSELVAFYEDFGKQIFQRSSLLKILKSFYPSAPLQQKLQAVFGKCNLFPEHLKCLLMVVTRNQTTDSPWPISSNPDARYNDPARPDCNLKIPLWQLVRASTAAPIYFPPESLSWDPNDPKKRFTFVDGGITPYNNPAFLLFRMATHPTYRLGWKTGEKNLLLVSLGTGSADTPDFKRNEVILTKLTGLPGALMHGMQVDQDINCRMVGRCAYGATIDRELMDLTCPDKALNEDQGRAFLYTRYDANLSQQGLEQLGMRNVDAQKVQKLDAVDQMSNLLTIGTAAAKQIDLNHFGSFVESGKGTTV
jgi:hypothetical protein